VNVNIKNIKIIKKILLFCLVGWGIMMCVENPGLLCPLGAQSRVEHGSILQAEAPEQVSPADNTEFDHLPRLFTLRWEAKRGLREAVYDIEIDCLNCTAPGKWDSDLSTSRLITGLTGTTVQYTFPQDNRGRWRVRARIGKISTKWSSWWYFTFSSSSYPGQKPNLCIDGFLRIGNRVTPWGQNYTVILTPQDAFNISTGKAGFDIRYNMKNCIGPSISKGFSNNVIFNDEIVGRQTNLTLGSMGSTLIIHSPVYLPLKDGILRIKLDAGNDIDEEWENDNEVWVKIKFSGF
jgi:hypothetical protein